MNSNSGAYKSWHKPNQSENARTMQGYYNVTNKDKYIGDFTQVIYRSSWECSFLRWCDMSPSVVRFSSEPLSIPYKDPTGKLEECFKYHLNPNDIRNQPTKNYHIDFYVEVNKTDHIEKWFIEIKPQNKLKKPIPPAKDASMKLQKRF